MKKISLHIGPISEKQKDEIDISRYCWFAVAIWVILGVFLLAWQSNNPAEIFKCAAGGAILGGPVVYWLLR